ncbi:MAG TPA: hypothetical protein DEG47_23965, partial [Cyanobacteria bacterium UBA11148]|nr:hypothetical protein [Cyanobacteria bacterium UBA11148]
AAISNRRVFLQKWDAPNWDSFKRIGLAHSSVFVEIRQAYNLATSRFSASVLPESCIKNYLLPQVSGRALISAAQ